MSIKCAFRGLGIKNKKYQPGDIILAPWLANSSILSPEYQSQHQGQRPPLLICLANNRLWSPDLLAAEDTTGWVVTGVAPLITIQPSVVCIDPSGQQQKFRIENGVITEVQ